MEELSNFEIFTRRILYFIGFLLQRMLRFFVGESTETGIKGFNSPLLWLTIGLFFAFAALHIFKRILRKG